MSKSFLDRWCESSPERQKSFYEAVLESNEEREQELLDSIHYALQNILIFRCKESDAPFSADMHLCQAIERLYSQIEFEPTDEEAVEHLDYALSIVEAAKPTLPEIDK